MGLKPVSRTPPRVAAAAPAAPAPPPAFDRTTVKAKGGAAGEEGGSPPPPPPYNGTAQRWGSSETRPAVAAAASPPPAYRDDVSSRFTETVRVTGSGGGSVSPRSGGGGSHSGPAANGSSRQTAGSKSPPHRPAPAYGGAATGSGQQRSACPQSPARSHNKPSSPSNGVRQQVPGAPRAVSPSAPPAPLPAATATTAPVTSPRRSPTGGRGGGYGLDAELAARREANYDYDAEAEAQEWIEDVTGERFAQGFEEELKDGRKLCLLINRIKPGAVRRVNDSRMPFKQVRRGGQERGALTSPPIMLVSFVIGRVCVDHQWLCITVHCGENVASSHVHPSNSVRLSVADTAIYLMEKIRRASLSCQGQARHRFVQEVSPAVVARVTRRHCRSACH